MYNQDYSTLMSKFLFKLNMVPTYSFQPTPTLVSFPGSHAPERQAKASYFFHVNTVKGIGSEQENEQRYTYLAIAGRISHNI